MAEAKVNIVQDEASSNKPLAVITGVSKGIGYHSALKLMEMGYTVAGCARSSSVMEQMNVKYEGHSFMAVDVSDANQVQKWASTIIETFGSPQLLLCNAGVAADRVLIEDAPNEVMDAIIDVNIKGVMFVVKYFIHSMKQNVLRPSRIVAISSASGRNGYAEMSPYCASKWAVEGFMASVAAEIPDHMMCCAYDPGGILTEMTIYLVPELKGNFEEAIKMGAIDGRRWAEDCVPHILTLNRKKHNGQPVERPDCAKGFEKNWIIYMKIRQQVLDAK